MAPKCQDQKEDGAKMLGPLEFLVLDQNAIGAGKMEKPDNKRIAEYVDTAPQPIKDVWNAAIDAAADKIHDEIGGDEEENAYWLERKVRELKKWKILD